MTALHSPGTMRGMLEITIGSRNTVPLRMLRIVPLGDFHICLSLNSAEKGREGKEESSKPSIEAHAPEEADLIKVAAAAAAGVAAA